MANGYTYTLKLKDLMSSGFAKAAKTSGSFFNSISSNSKRMKMNLDKLPNSIQGLETRLATLKSKQANAFSRKSIIKFNRGIRKTERQLRRLKNLPPPSMLSRIRRLGSGLGGLVGVTGLVGAGFAAFKGITGVAKLGAELEQTKVSFNTMLGSVERGSKMIASLDKFANKTPYSNGDIQESAKMLLNFGIAGEKVQPILRKIGDVASGDKEKLRGLTLAFSQVSSAGKLQGQDLNQMINQGFNPLLEISRTTGESMGSLREKMSNGAISAKMVEQAFTTATSEGGMFNGMMQKQSETLGGKWSTLIGTIRSKVAKLGEKIAPFLKLLVDKGIAIVNQFGKWYKWLVDIPSAIDNMSVKARVWIGIIGGAVAGLLLYKAVIGSIAIVIESIALAKKIWIGVQTILNVVMNANPIGIIILTIGALIGVIIAVASKTQGWGKSFKAVGTIIKVSALMIWEHIKFSFKNIGFGIKILALKFKKFGQWLKGFFKNIAKGIQLALKFDFSGAKKAFTAPIKTAADTEILRVKKEREALKAQYEKIRSRQVDEINTAASKISIKWKKTEKRKKTEKKSKNPFAFSGSEAIPDTTVPTEPKIPISQKTESEAASSAIASGGKKTKIFNITIERVVENINNKITEGREQGEDIVDEILDQLIRRLHGTTRTLDT